MTKEDRISYAEIYFVIMNMEKKYADMLPKALWQFICDARDTNYVVKYDRKKSLKNNGFSEYTYDILNLLNLNYWCDNLEKKGYLSSVIKEGAFKLVEHYGEELPVDETRFVTSNEILDNKKNSQVENNIKNELKSDISTEIEITTNYTDNEKLSNQNTKKNDEEKNIKENENKFLSNILKAIKSFFVNEELANEYNLQKNIKMDKIDKK